MKVRVVIEVEGDLPVTIIAREKARSSVQPEVRSDFEVSVTRAGRRIEGAPAIGLRRDLDPVVWAREIATAVALERESRAS